MSPAQVMHVMRSHAPRIVGSAVNCACGSLSGVAPAEHFAHQAGEVSKAVVFVLAAAKEAADIADPGTVGALNLAHAGHIVSIAQADPHPPLTGRLLGVGSFGDSGLMVLTLKEPSGVVAGHIVTADTPVEVRR